MRQADLEETIYALERLIQTGEKREEKYQRYFEEHPIVFQMLGYELTYPKLRLPSAGKKALIPDFLARRVGGLFDVIELKTPRERLLLDTDYRRGFRASIHAYINQVHEYVEYFDDATNQQTVRELYGLAVQKRPEVLVIAGTDKDTEKLEIHQYSRRQNLGIRFVTYDDILSMLNLHHKQLYEQEGRLAGVSFVIVLSLHDVPVDRRQYIFDAGDDKVHNRWSVYVDEKKRLCFEVIDKQGAGLMVYAERGRRGYPTDTSFILWCEFGTSPDYTVVQMHVNGRIIAQSQRDFGIDISTGLEFDEKVIAADISKQNHATTTIAALAIYDSVLSFQDRHAVYDKILDQFFSPSLVNGQLETSSTSLSPVIPNNSKYLVIK